MSHSISETFRWRTLLSFCFLLAVFSTANAAVLVTNSAPDTVAAAIEAGGTVFLAFEGPVNLSRTLVITTNTTVNATGHDISFDAGHQMRHFVITNGVTLQLINLNLINGSRSPSSGALAENGEFGFGGSIYNDGGIVELLSCNFIGNRTVGGEGGPADRLQEPGVSATFGGIGSGGAIFSINGELRATNCRFANNSAAGGKSHGSNENPDPPDGSASGGAISAVNSLLTFSETTFTNNLIVHELIGGQASGGAISDYGCNLTISKCTFVDNQALGHLDNGLGGAINHDAAPLTIDGTLFLRNRAFGGTQFVQSGFGGTANTGRGGALYSGGGPVQLSNCALILNEARGGDGDYMFVVDGGSGSGGAIYSFAEFNHMTNCTLTANIAKGGEGPNGGHGIGAAIASSANVPNRFTIANSTIAENNAIPGVSGAPHARFVPIPPSTASIEGSATLINTILSCSVGQTNVDTDPNFIYTSIIGDGGHNLCSDSSAKFTLPSSRNNIDPLLEEPANNGGPTPTMALRLGSPAIDAGDDAASPPTDQRGIKRPQGFASDIGAYELAPKLTIAVPSPSRVILRFSFLPGLTNRISGSANLSDWIVLDTRVTDANGTFQFEDSGYPAVRFYDVQTLAKP
jgi:hypothetical protein